MNPPRIPILPIFLNSAGCSHRCLYCNQRISGGEPADLETIAASVRAHFSRNERTEYEIALYGGSFTSLPPITQEQLLTAIQQEMPRHAAVRFRISARPDSFDSATAARLYKLGVRTIEFGVPSLHDDTLCLLRRGHTAADVQEATAAARAAGLAVVFQLMYGLPGETVTDTLGSVRHAVLLRPDAVRVHPTLVLPDTELEAWFRRGLYQPLSLKTAVRQGAAIIRVLLRAGIPIIRFGLQANELLANRALVHGPYHPAVRSLVASYLCRRFLRHAIQRYRLARGTSLTLNCSPSRVDAWIGYKKINQRRLQRRYGLGLHVMPLDEYSPGAVSVRDGTGRVICSGIVPF